MNWYKNAQSKSDEEIVKGIKHILKSHPMLFHIMDEFRVPHEDIDNNLMITFEDLEGKYAEGNGKEIHLDKSLRDNDNFLQENMHYVVHEFWHWVKRRSEDLHYFNDEEEVQSFTLGIAWEMLRGRTPEEATATYYPIVANQFEDKQAAKHMFIKMLSDANNLIQVYKNHA